MNPCYIPKGLNDSWKKEVMPFFYGFPTIMLNGKEGFNKFFIIYQAHILLRVCFFYVEIQVDQTNLQTIYKAIKQKMQEK